MNYYLWISGHEHGPYSLEEIQQSIDDGDINPRQTARTESCADWKPLQQIARLKLPTPQKSATAQPTPSSSQPKITQEQKRVETHLATIRKHTCYGVLRSIIEISFVVSLIAVGLALVSGIESLGNNRAGMRIAFLFGAALAAILLVAARQSALLLIDIADTLLHEHSKDRSA